MKLLLDTHAFLWWDDAPSRLPAGVMALCLDPNNTVLLSVATIWELQIKIQLCKLSLSRSLKDVVLAQESNGLIVVPIGPDHIHALDSLPLYHKDPFDRMLLAQATVERATLVSHDRKFNMYGVSVIW